MQDYGGPVGLRITFHQHDRVQALIIQPTKSGFAAFG
jgi:hypothetical protein